MFNICTAFIRMLTTVKTSTRTFVHKHGVPGFKQGFLQLSEPLNKIALNCLWPLGPLKVIVFKIEIVGHLWSFPVNTQFSF
jgi:hypothetical protein